jgi:hypothetical protein
LNEEASVHKRADDHLRTTGKFSTLDWPSPSMVLEARRARGLYLRGLVISFAKWVRESIAAIGAADSPRRRREITRH